MLPFSIYKGSKIIGDLSRHADSYAVGKDDFADWMSHFHRVHPLSSGEDDLPCVIVDAHRKKPSVLARRFLADLGLPVIEVAFIHSDLPAEGSGGHVALKEGLILQPKVSIVSIRVLIYEPQKYSGGVMQKRQGLPNAYYCFISVLISQI